MAISTDVKVDFIVNTMSRQTFNELCASGNIQDNQMYLIDDDVLDAFGRKVVNVEDPDLATDAVNVRYLSSYYIEQSQITSFVDSTKIFNSAKSQYVDSSLNEYNFIFTDWKIQLTADTFTKDDVEIRWNPRTDQGRLNGYNLVIKEYVFETGEYSQDATLIHNIENHTTLGKFEIICTRTKTSVKVDSYISKKKIYECLSSITVDSGIEEIRSAMLTLNEKLSGYAD